MYVVDQQFITAIKNNARYIKCYFKYGNAQYNPITVSIDDNVYKTSSDGDAFIGTFIGKSGTIKLRVNDNLDIENKDLELFFGIVVSADSVNYVPMGTYRVYEKTSNSEFKICDHKLLFNEKIDTTEITYPTTPSNLATWVGGKVGIEVIIPTDLPNKDLAIPSEVFFGYDATYANVVEAIAQATCTFAHISRENKLEFRWFKNVDFTINVQNMPKGYPTLSDCIDPINTVVLAREPQNDNVYWPETVEGERSEFKISNNPILDIDRYTSRMDIYDRINGFSYTPVSIETQGFFHLDTGDIVKLEKSDGVFINMLIMNHTLSFSGGISSKFETPALSKTMINYAAASSVESRIYNTQLQVDKVKNEITAEISEINKKVEQIDTTSYTVSNIVSATSITKDNSSITMQAKVYLSGEDVTASTLNTAFNWIRVSDDAASDTVWNNAHKGLKVITLTSEDLTTFANFECKVTLATGVLETGYTTIKDESQLGTLSVNLSCDKPSYQVDNGGTLFPSWNPMTITPDCSVDGVHVDLTEVTIIYKRKIGDAAETNLITGETVENGILKVSKDMLSLTNPLLTYVCYATKGVDTYKSTFSFVLSKNGEDGVPGETGTSVSDMVDEFYLSTSKTDLVGGEWSTTNPEWESGKYLWRRTKISYAYPTKIEYSTAFVDTTWEATIAVKDELITNDNKIYNEITTNYSTAIEQLKDSITSMVKASYATESELASAVETLTSQIVQNATSITATTTAVKEVTDKITGLATKEEISQWATYADGILKLASSNSAFSVRLSQTELGFYQGETRIAYLSNQQLYITQAVILRSIRMNNFTIDDDEKLGFFIH